MRMLGRNPKIATAISAMLASSAMLAGCASDHPSSPASLGSVFTGRPRVSVSVAEAHPGSGVDQLNFFDALEKRDLVSHDDALHATLLLFAGQSGQTYVQRVGRAKQMGLLDAKFDRPAREAITIGELSTVLAAGMRRPDARSESTSMQQLRQMGVLPDFAADNSGISGAQLLTILGHAEDAMATNPVPSSPTTSNEVLRPFTSAERALAGAGMFATQPERKPPRKSPIDLEKEAQKPRPGQILPDNAPGAQTPDLTPPPNPSPDPSPAPDRNPAPTPPPSPAPTPAPTPSAGPKPLPPPRAEGGVPSRFDGVASDLRYVAVDRVSVNVTEVLGPGEFVQWRAVDDGRGRPGEWQTLQPGDPINDRVEIRTGIGARVSLNVGEVGEVVLHRLSRIRLERKIRSDASSQVGITVYRGVVEASSTVQDGDYAAILVKTPDQAFPLRRRALFEYDAFKGTLAREFQR